MNNPWARLSEQTKLQIIKWSYLVIVIAATITLATVVIYNKNLLNDIQNDRKKVTYDACIAQNERNTKLINFVDEINLERAIKKAKEEGKPLPSEPPPMEPTTRKFINVLSRYRDCDQVVINIFGSPYNEK